MMDLEKVPDKLLFPQISNLTKRRFLTAYAYTGRLTRAAKLAGCDIRSHYNWKMDEVYNEAYLKAHDIAADLAEDEIFRRAYEGYDHPVTYEGEITDTYKAYSDTLSIFWLKGQRPEKYRDNASGITFEGPVQINVNIRGGEPGNGKENPGSGSRPGSISIPLNGNHRDG